MHPATLLNLWLPDSFPLISFYSVDRLPASPRHYLWTTFDLDSAYSSNVGTSKETGRFWAGHPWALVVWELIWNCHLKLSCHNWFLFSMGYPRRWGVMKEDLPYHQRHSLDSWSQLAIQATKRPACDFQTASTIYLRSIHVFHFPALRSLLHSHP